MRGPNDCTLCAVVSLRVVDLQALAVLRQKLAAGAFRVFIGFLGYGQRLPNLQQIGRTLAKKSDLKAQDLKYDKNGRISSRRS